MNVRDFIAAALRNIGNLRARHWALLVLVYSGRAMLPLLPAELSGADWLHISLSVTATLVLFWMPYLFIRAMAGEARPGRPNSGLLLFIVVAILVSAVQSVPATLAHMRFEAGVSPGEAQLWMLLAGALGALLTVRLLPIYAGTATQILSPLERYWWAGIRGSALSLSIVVVGIFLIGQAVQTLLPDVGTVFSLGNITLSHARESVRAAGFLATCALALAACQYCARLQEGAPPR